VGAEEEATVVLPAVKEQILADLERLSPEQQKQAAELVHGLVSPPRGTAGRDLLRFAGTLDDESAREEPPSASLPPIDLKLSQASPPTTWRREEINGDDGR
jgi:hypothetical protein